MAIAVPYLLTALTAASATTVALVSVAFAVTGINDKINKAAASVFGEDLVKVANIVGAAYGAWNGGFDIGGADKIAGITEGATELANAADVAGGLDPSIAQLSPAELAGGMPEATQTLAGVTPGGADAASNLAQTTASTSAAPSAAADTVSAAAKTSVPELAKVDYGVSGAAKSQGLTAASATQAQAAAPVSVIDRLKGAVLDKNGNFSNSALQLGGNVLQGAFGGYSAAKARDQANTQYDEEVARRMRLANMGAAGWRQTQ